MEENINNDGKKIEEQSSDKKIKVMKVKVHGMHCGSCEVLVERNFKKLPGIESVKVNHASGKAKVFYTEEPNIEDLENTIKEHGYKVSHWNERHLVKHDDEKPDYLTIGGIVVIVVSAYLLLKRLNLIPDIGVSDTMSLGFVFLIGLVASMSTCLAATGGLLIAIASKYKEKHPELTGKQAFRPHVYFNIGRVVSYTILGGLVGAIGSLFTLSPTMNGVLTIIIAVVMLLLGFQMLNIFPFLRNFQFKMPKFLAHKIHDSSNSDHKLAPFSLGAATFFLPCGFTQALQLYVLSKGDFMTGAITMLVFSLGTLPALVSLGAVSSYAKGSFKKTFMKFAGVIVVLLAIFSIGNSLKLFGVTSFSSSNPAENGGIELVNGKQVIDMSVNGLDYYPSEFRIMKGVPVEWRIDGRKAQGCAQVLVASKLGITRRLSRDSLTVVEFTPQQTGKIIFTCGMGMAGPGTFNVVA